MGGSSTPWLHRHLLPAVLPLPAAQPPARSASSLRPAAAEAEGFRACRRCRAARAGDRRRSAGCGRRSDYLDRHLDETVTLDRLGRAVGLSPYHLQRTFKRITGVSPRAYAGGATDGADEGRLEDGDSVSRATYDAGYSSPSRAYDDSRRRLGMTPGDYRRRRRRVRIRLTTVDTALGAVLVAATERGLCSSRWATTPPAWRPELRREYPAARSTRDDDELRGWAGAGGRAGSRATRPSACRSTCGARRSSSGCGRRCSRSRAATTRIYAEVARELGQPTAARAVARACATNQVAVVIPCHRVVRGDGGLGGYRWGIERKRELLEVERPPRAWSRVIRRSSARDRRTCDLGVDRTRARSVRFAPDDHAKSLVRSASRSSASSSPSHSASQLASMMFSEHPTVLHRSAPRADSMITRGRAPVPRCSSTIRTL